MKEIIFDFKDVELYREMKHKYNMMDARHYMLEYAYQSGYSELEEKLSTCCFEDNIYHALEYLADVFQSYNENTVAPHDMWMHIVERFFEGGDYSFFEINI